MGLRGEVYKSGLGRVARTAEIAMGLEQVAARDQGGSSTEAVAEAYNVLLNKVEQLRESDNLDADLRDRGRASVDAFIDGEAERRMGEIAAGDSTQSAAAKDAPLIASI